MDTKTRREVVTALVRAGKNATKELNKGNFDAFEGSLASMQEAVQELRDM